MICIYAEKPDMAKTISKALDPDCEFSKGYIIARNNGLEYYVTWGYGHLCVLQDAKDYGKEYEKWNAESYPVLPVHFKLKLKNDNGIRSQYGIIKSLFNKAEYIINATDPDSEGELIFAYIYEYMGCKVNWKRLWIHSTTQAHIREQMQHLLTPSEIYTRIQAARARSESDWLIGINGTVFYSLASNQFMTLGRVQTPTLAIVVYRDEEIKKHVKKKYWQIKGTFSCGSNFYSGDLLEPQRFDRQEDAIEIKKKISGKNGIVVSVETKNVEKKPPLLYNLETLQKDANVKYGFSAKKTLLLTQSLYEHHLCTYPRTEWRALPEDMLETAVATLKSLDDYPKYKDYINNFCPGKPYFDIPTESDSHYAIIPTTIRPKDLTGDERKIYNLLCDSLIRIFMNSAEIQNTVIKTKVEEFMFISNGSKVVKPGWMLVNSMPDEEILPQINIGQAVAAKDIEINQSETKASARFTDATLIAYMKNCGKNVEDKELAAYIKDTGIGRSSTRADIIEGLVRKRYIERSGKSLIPTETGIQLIKNLTINELKSPLLTASWEMRLQQIRDGIETYEDVMSDMRELTKKICTELYRIEIKDVPIKNIPIGKCPLCGNEVIRKNWGWGCSSYSSSGCSFSISNTICKKKISETTVKKILNGKSVAIKGFTGKSGNKFNAKLQLIKGKIEFVF